MSFWNTLFGSSVNIVLEEAEYNAHSRSGKIVLTSQEDTALQNIELVVTAGNDIDGWIEWFYTDNEFAYDEVEVLGIYSNLMAWMPFTINFTSKVLGQCTLENLEKYVDTIRDDPEYSFEEYKVTFIDSFLNPEWSLELRIDGKTIWEIMLSYENPELDEYLNNL